MAKKPMKPAAPGAAMASKGAGMKVDDVSAADVRAGSLRPRHSTADGDAALGRKGYQTRATTNASAQFRITATRNPAAQPEYPGTLASGRILPSVMGSKQRQNFDADAAFSNGG